MKAETTKKEVSVHSQLIFKMLRNHQKIYFMTSKRKKVSLGQKNIHSFHCRLILGPKMK